MKKNCLQCNKEFSKPHNRSIESWNTANFCSQKCRGDSMKGKPFCDNTGKKQSPEHIRKCAEAKKGHLVSQETKDKIGLSNKGKIHSLEQNKAMSLRMKGGNSGSFQKGHKHTEEILGKIRLSNIGKKQSIESNKKRSEKMKGKKHPYMTGEKNLNWNNGSSFLPYSVDWTKTLRQSIRERDKYTCICGEKQGDIGFDVHHIDYNKQNCNPDNLITLCKPCHVKTNTNRNYWIEFFKK